MCLCLWFPNETSSASSERIVRQISWKFPSIIHINIFIHLLFCMTRSLVHLDDVMVTGSFEPITTLNDLLLLFKWWLGTSIFSCSCFSPCLKVTDVLFFGDDWLFFFASVDALIIPYLENKTRIEWLGIPVYLRWRRAKSVD